MIQSVKKTIYIMKNVFKPFHFVYNLLSDFQCLALISDHPLEQFLITKNRENGEYNCWVCISALELQRLERLWNHENMFETGVVRANEC